MKLKAQSKNNFLEISYSTFLLYDSKNKPICGHSDLPSLKLTASASATYNT